MNPCPKAAMREIRPSGLMSGIWKRAPRYRARSRLYTSQSAREISALWSRSGSGSGGESDLSRPKQGVGLLPRFVSDAGWETELALPLSAPGWRLLRSQKAKAIGNFQRSVIRYSLPPLLSLH